MGQLIVGAKEMIGRSLAVVVAVLFRREHPIWFDEDRRRRFLTALACALARGGIEIQIQPQVVWPNLWEVLNGLDVGRVVEERLVAIALLGAGFVGRLVE